MNNPTNRPHTVTLDDARRWHGRLWRTLAGHGAGLSPVEAAWNLWRTSAPGDDASCTVCTADDSGPIAIVTVTGRDVRCAFN